MTLRSGWDIDGAASERAIAAAFKEFGFIVLRAALRRQDVLKLGASLTAEFSRLAGAAAGLDEDLRKSLARSELPAHPQQAPFRLDPGNYAALTSSDRLAAALRAAAGEDYAWHYPPMFRQVSAQRTAGLLPFHQDLAYNTRYERLFTCFTPLNDCGEDSPALELVGADVRERFTHAASGAWESKIPDEELAAFLKSAPLFHPTLAAGDVIVFHEHTLHRTYHTAGMSRPRLSMDARAIPCSCITEDSRKNRKFIDARRPQFTELNHGH